MDGGKRNKKTGKYEKSFGELAPSSIMAVDKPVACGIWANRMLAKEASMCRMQSEQIVRLRKKTFEEGIATLSLAFIWE